jgi:Rrf2 family transcriptional regulator, cysteine metabolism repressor
MLRLNKKMEYGIIALLYLDTKEDKTASVREIAASCGVPETLLSKVMQSLKSENLVSAVYGNHGGYRLSQSLSAINLLDLTRSVVGPVHVASCLEPGNHDCPAQSQCTLVSPMEFLNQKIIELFQSTSLETLASRKVAV